MRRLLLATILLPVLCWAQGYPLGGDNSFPPEQPPPNNAPVWNSTPSPTFSLGTASSYNILQDVSDADGDDLTITNETGCTLPTGVTVDDVNDEIDYDGGGSAGTTASCVFGADDGTAARVDSDSFSIVISDYDTFVIDPCNGDDTDDGSAANPWATWTKANASQDIGPGDTVEMKWNGIQACQDQDDMAIKPTWSGTDLSDDVGTPGQEITITNTAGFTPELAGDSSGDRLVHFEGVSFIRMVENDTGGILVGDIDDWNEASEASGGSGYTHGQSIRIDGGSHHIDIQVGELSGGSSYTGNYIDESTYLIRLRDIPVCGYHGTNDADFTNADDGDFLRVRGADRVIIENMDCGIGGHSLFLLQANRLVFRDSDIDQDWTGTTSDYTGSRCYEVDATWSNKGATSPYGPQLMENILCFGGGTVRDNPSQATGKFSNHQGIARFNYMKVVGDQDQSECLLIPILGTDNNVSNQTGEMTIAYNTCYDTDRMIGVNDTNGPYTNVFDQNWWISNLVTDCDASQCVQMLHPNYGIESYSNMWKGDFWDGNRISESGSGEPQVTLGNDGGGSTSCNLLSCDTQWPNEWTSDNTIDKPTFVNATAHTRAGYALASGSNGIDEGKPIANVEGAYNGATITVDRPQAIYDSWNMWYFDENDNRDCLKIGSNSVVQVAENGVNESTGQVQLEATVSGSDGDDIFWADCGGTIYNNTGASQVDP